MDGAVYTATTDAEGYAVFSGYDGAEFPNGTKLKAEKDDFETAEWEQGEDVPRLKETEDTDDLTFLIVLVVIVLVILVIAILIAMGRKKEEMLEE
jgi:hypothetical protein